MRANVGLTEKTKVAPRKARSSASVARVAAAAPLGFAKIARSALAAPHEFMHWRPCPVCGGDDHRPIMEYDNFQFYTDADRSKQVTIRQVLCLHCFAVFMNPVFTPEGFAVLFAEAGASYGSTSVRQGEQIEWLKDHGLLAAGSTLLDIGCYDGTFIANLPAGVNGVGVDIDEPAIVRARQRFGAATPHRFICADFERFEIDGAIDTITMFHVLEHLPRPLSVLRRLAELASSRTRLVVEVPIAEHVIYGDICGFVTVQHLTHFTVASLNNVLHVAGWHVIESQKMPGYNGFRVVAEPAPSTACVPSRADIGLFLNYLSRWYGAVSAVETKLDRIYEPNCILRGGGLQTEYLYQLTSLFAGERNFLIVDSDKLKQGKTWRGISIVGPDILSAADWNNTQMILSSYSHQEAMREEARSKGIPETAILSLYDWIWRY